MKDPGAVDDEALVASRSGSEHFEVVFKLRAREIWRYLAARLDHSAADELLSEVFLRAFAARSRYDPQRGSARGWLYGIANNVCREHLRYVGDHRLADVGEDVAHPPTAPDAADRTVDRRMLSQVIDSLPDERREVILLIAAFGLSYEETAQALAVPVGTVRSRFFRARRQLRTLLQDERSGNDAQRIP
ncbi:MAG: RNA polymerase sigma factor [Acidimicrobiales bacterium]